MNLSHQRVCRSIKWYERTEITPISPFLYVQKLDKDFYSFFDGRMHKNSVWSGIVEGMIRLSFLTQTTYMCYNGVLFGILINMDICKTLLVKAFIYRNFVQAFWSTSLRHFIQQISFAGGKCTTNLMIPTDLRTFLVLHWTCC